MEAAGALLREARRRAGLSQVELARRAGVTQSVVSAYESGGRQPSLPTLARLVNSSGFELDIGLSDPRLNRLTGPLGERVRTRRHEVREVVARYGLGTPRVFGSVARGEDREDSDVDLLIDVPAGVGLFTLGRCREELEELLGVQVDLVPASDLKPQLAPFVLVEAVVVAAKTVSA